MKGRVVKGGWKDQQAIQACPPVWSLPCSGHRLSWEAGSLVLPCLPPLSLFWDM